MNKILLLSVVCVAIVWSSAQGVHISGMDFDDNFLEDDESGVEEKEPHNSDLIAKLAETCLIQILGPSVSCVMRSLTKWNVNPHQLRININHKPTCCSIWEMTDCLLDKAQVYCSEDEKIAFEAHLSQQTQNRNEKNCSLFQYKSDSCALEPLEEDDSPVFNEVVFRENNHFVKPNQLADEVPHKKSLGHLYPAKLYPAISRVGQQSDVNMGALDGMALAQHLLDRVERITIHKMVIEMHPRKDGEKITKQEIEQMEP